ncbi:hypothetical protein ANN_20371 [Periplaneta americana]|uniref:Uncharacterized protein n=1 Tax=Periplaneta americana TaxID=6978 RepID=A0ABQ8SDJ5_PERAM|nr:hypothetical protein ANN_20371 [Periplaneta americana]
MEKETRTAGVHPEGKRKRERRMKRGKVAKRNDSPSEEQTEMKMAHCQCHKTGKDGAKNTRDTDWKEIDRALEMLDGASEGWDEGLKLRPELMKYRIVTEDETWLHHFGPETEADNRVASCKFTKEIEIQKYTFGRLRVFENKVLRKIFGAKRDDVTEEWRKLHITELHALYYSPDIIRNIKSRCLRWAGHVARMDESTNAYRVLVGRPKGKRPLGRPRRRWEDNIKMDLREVGYDDRDWINLAQDRDLWRAYVRVAMNLRFL